MNINRIEASQSSSLAAYGRAGRPQGPPPPPPPLGSQSDSLEISSDAMSQYLSNVSDSVKAATSDLQGSKTNLMQDLRTIGDYFRDNGGRQALDAYMKSNFSQSDLASFMNAVGNGSGGQSQVSDSVTAATSDLQGSKTNSMQDLRTIGDYFRDNGGRQALDAYMKSNFSQIDLASFLKAAGHGPGSGGSSPPK